MKKVLVTGGSGFIGRHALLPLIDRGYEVHCIYRSNQPDIIREENLVEWHPADLLNRKEVQNLLGSISPTYLLHLAWDVTPGSYLESKNNFDWLCSSLYLLQDFSEFGGKRAVCAGTCFEYDLHAGYCTENNTPTVPVTFYGFCKNQFRVIGEKYADKMALDFAWGRIFYPFGPNENTVRLVPSVINSLLSGEVALCTHGTQIRDFLYVADVADAFAALLDSEVNGIVNIGSGKPVSIKEMVQMIAKNLGKDTEIRFGALPSRADEPSFIVADTGRLNKEVNWHQKFSLEEGIKNTIAWWKEYGNDSSHKKTLAGGT
jgi:nucleoside-diphosphate-sugar epimerase